MTLLGLSIAFFAGFGSGWTANWLKLDQPQALCLHLGCITFTAAVLVGFDLL